MTTVRLTDGEKRQRGTFQGARATQARDLATVQGDIAEVEGFIDALRVTARGAAAAIKLVGPIVPTGRGGLEKGKGCKPNPAVRIQASALDGIQRLKRDLTFLREEETAALARVKPEHDEFEGLD
jgi:hypothetical protein